MLRLVSLFVMLPLWLPADGQPVPSCAVLWCLVLGVGCLLLFLVALARHRLLLEVIV